MIVSSEDNEILSYAKECGAKQLKRNDKLSKDTSTVVEVCTDIITILIIKVFLNIYATTVKLTTKTIQNSFTEFNKMPNCDFLMGVSLYNYPPSRPL